MPRFFFDLTDAKGLHRDAVGDECSDLGEAREQCQGILTSAIKDELPSADLHIVLCDLRNDAGRIVYRGEITYRGTRGEMPCR